MPDDKGETKADPPSTPLHAYKEGREEEVEQGSLGVDTGGKDSQKSRLPEGADESGSYQSGGFAGDEPDPAAPGRAEDAANVDRAAGTAGGALEDTVEHPDEGDEGLGTRTGGIGGRGDQ